MLIGKQPDQAAYLHAFNVAMSLLGNLLRPDNDRHKAHPSQAKAILKVRAIMLRYLEYEPTIF